MATTTTNDTPGATAGVIGPVLFCDGWLRLLLPEKKSSWYNTLRVPEPGLWTTQSLC